MTAIKEARYIVGFCIVGAAGFLIDAAGLALVQHLGAGPLSSRAVSIPVAMGATYLLNRMCVFRDRTGPWLVSFLAYFFAQCAGALLNWVAFALAVVFAPKPFNQSLYAFPVASASALLLNYSGVRFFAFNIGTSLAHNHTLRSTIEIFLTGKHR